MRGQRKERRMRTTIDYGIDLGTTNSEIAILREMKPEIIPNSKDTGSVITPSAVYIDRKGQVHVGHEAYQRHWVDPDNAKIEFKLLMGQGEKAKQVFSAIGRQMLPEELSAEVLKSLKADARLFMDEEVTAAVITVPAAFEVDQCDATRKAAELAGFVTSPLLQEPVAAALAYGFQSTSENVFWMVYDFGGGTFDAAIIHVRDGVIQVVNQEGDNYLGGQRIDWDIVEKKLIPVLIKKYKLPDFRRGGDPKWIPAIARLKMAAEQAKIEASRKQQSSLIWFDPPLCQDEKGQVVDFEYEITPNDVEEITSPYITRSINLSKKALAESNLSPRSIEKIIFVGGTSLIPWLRQRLKKELGIPLDSTINPITVVAQGAAIFAGTQKFEGVEVEVPAGSFKIDLLEYKPIGSDTNPPVAGRITRPQGISLEGYTIEFVENRSQWRSGKILLNTNGTFMTEVHAEKGYKCEFLIELCDPSGTRQSAIPDRFSYTVGVVITNPPLTHSIGVAMANNKPDIFFEKGTPLPARTRHIHKTVLPVRKGQKGDLVKIPFIEGEYKKADRNDLIGHLEIPSDDPRVKRDVPVGSDVEITIHIDESRIITSKAYIPILDEEFEKVLNYEKETESVAKLQESFEREKKRLDKLREKAGEVDSKKADEAMERIEQEQIGEEVQSLLEASEGDQRAVPGAQNRLADFKAANDEVEDAIEWPSLLEDARGQLEFARYYVNKDGDADEKTGLKALEEDMQEIIDTCDPNLLRRHTEKIHSLGMQIALRKPDIWIRWLEYCEERQSSIQNITKAEQLITQARLAINNNDLEGLQAAIRQLISLLPQEQQYELPGGFGGTTIKLN